MTAEQLSASIVKTIPLQSRQMTPEGYFRSKLFITPFSANPLVAAAGPIFSLLERLNSSLSLPPINKLRDNIEHEVYAFHSRLRTQISNEESIALAQYIISATIDELVGKAYMKSGTNHPAFKAFTPSSFDNIGPEERFFIIIDHLKESPNQFLDLIELAYYCLIAGFEGIQHGKPNGRHLLDTLLEDLFQLIQQYRVNQHYKLFNPTKAVDLVPQKTQKSVVYMGLASFGLLVASYFASYAILESKARSVQFGHAVIAQLDN